MQNDLLRKDVLIKKISKKASLILKRNKNANARNATTRVACSFTVFGRIPNVFASREHF